MKLGNLTRTYKGDDVPRLTSFTYCGASIFRDACYQLVAAFLITYITFSGILDVSKEAYLAQMLVINIFIIICRIWDGINDPIMGWIIEKVKFKWGKYKPWILMGAIGNTIVVLTLFLARPSGWGFVTLFCIFYFLWDLVYTVNDIAYWSMLPSMTSDEKKRNRITAGMQICISLGTFIVYGAVPLLVEQGKAQFWYGLIAIIVTSLFLISQIVLVFVCKERDRGEEQDKIEHENIRFSDMFSIFKHNDQFRISIISIFLNYLGAGVLVGFGMYYFYLMYGYGNDQGGSVQFMFTVMYAIGTLIAQIVYPFLSKIMNRKKMLIMSGVIFILGYIAMFFLGFPIFGPLPIASGSWIALLYACGLIIFFGQGIFAIVIIIQMQSTIEYNEYLFGERKESIVSSMRALVAKFSSAVQQGLIYLTLMLTGLYAITQEISQAESLIANGIITQTEMEQTVSEALSKVTQNQLIGLSIGMVLVPLILMLTSLFLSTFVFKIDEKKYAEMMEAISKGKHKCI